MNTQPTHIESEIRNSQSEGQTVNDQHSDLGIDSTLFNNILEISRFIPTCETFEEAGRFIFDKCKELTGARSGYVALLTDDGQENEVLFLDSGGLACSVDPDLPMPIRGLRADAYSSGQVVYDNSFSESRWMAYMPPGHVTLKNVLFAPINVDGKIVGLIGIANKPGDFNEEDAHITSALGDLAAVALTHAEAKEKLQENERRFRQITDVMHEALSVIDLNGTVLYANKNATINMVGDKYPSVIGKNISRLLPESQANELIKKYGSVYRSGKRFNQEIKSHFSEGERWFLNSLQPIDFGMEKTKAILSISLDITDRKEQEVQLAESEEKYRSMMESMDEPAYICSADFRLEYMNPAMISKIGRDATGELCYKSIHDLDANCLWCAHHRVMQGENHRSELVKQDEDTVYSVSFSPIFHTDESISQLTVYRDITEQKKVENRIQQAQKLESIGTLAGGIAHDFNNILAPIIGLSEMLIEDLAQDTILQKNAKHILQAGERAADLVKQILAFSRQSEEKLIPIDIKHILKEVLKLSRATLPTNIQITKEIDNNSGLVLANPTHIHQIAMNLITNAFHAVEETGGTIHITLHQTELSEDDLIARSIRPGRYAVFTCSDTGHGIPPEMMEKLFEPYFTTKGKDKGTGLGLAVVYGIVNEYGGDIQIRSELDKGTSVKVMLPIIDDSVEKVPAQKASVIPTGAEHVLLVDDELALLQMEGQMLKRLGYRATIRKSSQEALETFKAHPRDFDVVVTDMMMPGMTGDKLAIKIREIRPEIPIIICTGFSQHLTTDTVVSMGLNGLLKKPILSSDLAKMLRNVLDTEKNTEMP